MKNKAIVNFIVTAISQVILLLISFLLPRLIMINYGSDTNGFISTTSQIFTYLALLEAGITQATKNLLYPKITSKDKDGISYIVALSKRQYRVSSIFYAGFVLALSFILPFLLKTELNYFTIVLFVLFEGMSNVLVFIFVNTWSALLACDGKSYINSIFSFSITILFYISKIICFVLKWNILLVELFFFLLSILKVLLYFLYFKKRYSWIVPVKPNKDDKLKDKNSYIVTEIAWTIFSSTDMIVLSICVSTALSSVYSVYNLIFVAFSSFLNSLYSSLNYLLGISYSKNIEKYKKVHDAFNSIFMTAVTIFVCVSYWLLPEFISIYTSDVTDINYFYEWLPLCFCLIPLLSWSRYCAGNLSGIAGYAKQVSRISIIEAVSNVVLSFALVWFLGIYGVLLATLVSLPLKVIYLNILAEKTILKRKPIKTLLILLSNYALFGLTVLFNHFIKIPTGQNYGSLIINGLSILLFYILLVSIINLLINRDVLHYLTKIVIKGLSTFSKTKRN